MSPGETIDRRILSILSERYPITVDELGRMLHMSASKTMLELRKMALKGLVELEFLPDKTFIRPLFVLNRKQKKSSDGKEKTENKTTGGDDPAYR